MILVPGVWFDFELSTALYRTKYSMTRDTLIKLNDLQVRTFLTRQTTVIVAIVMQANDDRALPLSDLDRIS